MGNKANLFNKTKKNVGKLDKANDAGYVNRDTKSAMVSKADGGNSITAGPYAQSKMDQESGTIINYSLHNNESSVVKNLDFVDLNVNSHKFNNRLVELADFRDINGNTIGGLCMDGTVLVKTYEHSLKKWVLIRRPYSAAMFSHRLNIPSVSKQLGLDMNEKIDNVSEYYIKKEE